MEQEYLKYLLRVLGSKADRNTAPSPGPLQPTGMFHPATGRPVMKDGEGQQYTEYSITVLDPRLNEGRPTNIPSIWNGQIMNEDQAIQFALKSGRRYPSYNTVAEAVAEAQKRSDRLGILQK